MADSTARQLEMERKIRERLEEMGQFGKMRAMIVDAALQSLARDQPADARSRLFLPSPSLTAAKEDAAGRQALGNIYAHLQRLGLQYTASVLALETGMTAAELTAAAGDAPTESSTLAPPNGPARVVPAPTPVPGVAPASSQSSSAPGRETEETSTASSKSDEASALPSATAREEKLPGAEDSTYYISKWKNKSFLRVDQVVGQQVQVEYLTDCTVTVLDPLDSMTVDDCEGGELVIAACEGSVFLRNCKNMTVHVACKQLRTRDCANIDLHILTTTDPVVEMSHHMTFRPFHLRLPRLTASLRAARLDPALNRFVHVYDFTVDEPSLPKPHYTVLYPNHGVAMEDRYADHGSPECPPQVEDILTGKLRPAASSETGQNKSYDIKTGSAAWAAAAVPNQATTPASDSSDSSDESVESAENTAAGAAAATIPVPTAGGARPPVAPAPAARLAGPRPGGLDDEEYSSFDESSESDDADDKYGVDEDDDDF